jgi:nicotinate phosphoribosyltransferase
MIPTALYDNPQKIIDTMYDIDRKWQEHFPSLWIILPDTYGTSFYYDNCPQDIIKNHNGTRFDSKDPMEAIPEYVDWLLKNNQNPQEKAWIPSDWLNSRNASEIQETHHDSVGNLSFWIGTNLSNNTKGIYPRKEEHGPFGSFSVVIKPARVQRPDGTWVSCVKLSDNPEKAVWDSDRVQFFKEIFWANWVKSQEVLV